ncbi:MAG TPA: hypothetical protein VHN99_01380, partial [Deinococcales bacterium]|nr:hypothetical protein [Deinococcales bacterium]
GLDVAGRSGSRFPVMRLITWDPQLAVQSARRLAELPVTTLACGHGPVLLNARAPLRAAVARAEAALQRAAA